MLDCITLSLKENLKRLILQELKITLVTPEELTDDELLFSDRLGLDSIDAVEVVYLVEKHFGVAIKDMKEGRPALQSINTLAAFIEARVIQAPSHRPYIGTCTEKHISSVKAF